MTAPVGHPPSPSADACGGNLSPSAVLDEESRQRAARETFKSSLRKLKFTRGGKVFVAFTLGVGLAALNTGNNLLFLVLGLLLATILVSGVLAESSLRQVQVERLPGPDPVARESFLHVCRVWNRKARGASFCLTVRDVDSPLSHGEALAVHVPAGESSDASVEVIAPHRGRYRLTAVRLATTFPFGFFEKSRVLEVPGELYVLPGRRRLDASLDEILGREGELPGNRAGDGTELWQLRDLADGDDLRRVHHVKSASVGRYLVAEREAECAPRLVVTVDNGHTPQPQLEDDLENAAALVRELDLRGFETGLATCGAYLPPASGPAHLQQALRLLASTESTPGVPLADVGGEATVDAASLRGKASPVVSPPE